MPLQHESAGALIATLTVTADRVASGHAFGKARLRRRTRLVVLHRLLWYIPGYAEGCRPAGHPIRNPGLAWLVGLVAAYGRLSLLPELLLHLPLTFPGTGLPLGEGELRGVFLGRFGGGACSKRGSWSLGYRLALRMTHGGGLVADTGTLRLRPAFLGLTPTKEPVGSGLHLHSLVGPPILDRCPNVTR